MRWRDVARRGVTWHVMDKSISLRRVPPLSADPARARPYNSSKVVGVAAMPYSTISCVGWSPASVSIACLKRNGTCTCNT